MDADLAQRAVQKWQSSGGSTADNNSLRRALRRQCARCCAPVVIPLSATPVAGLSTARSELFILLMNGSMSVMGRSCRLQPSSGTLMVFDRKVCAIRVAGGGVRHAAADGAGPGCRLGWLHVRPTVSHSFSSFASVTFHKTTIHRHCFSVPADAGCHAAFLTFNAS